MNVDTKDLVDMIVECAKQVRSQLTPGFEEKVYKNALYIEMLDMGLPVETEVSFKVYYKDKIKVVFIEDYRVSNGEIIFAAADVSEQISTASREASGTGNMKFMINGAPTLGTMDGANVEIVEEVGAENAFIFGLSADEVMRYEREGGYNPWDIYNNNQNVRRVLTQLINGTYNEDTELFRDLYDSLTKEDVYFILKDFDSYVEAQQRVDAAYRDKAGWARMAMMNTACSGKFSSDRTIEQYVKDIWKLKKVEVTI
jgi:starch phosphorylase